MDLTRKLELLDQQIADANSGHPSNFEAWKQKTEVVLRNVLGRESPIIESFHDNRYHPSIWTENTDFAS